MTPDQEKQVLATIYDRLFDALTHVPGGGKTADFDKATTLLQMTKNAVLNPDDYKNAASSINPKGDLKTTFALSELVDVLPTVSAEWGDSGKPVSLTYKTIVDGANADNSEDPKGRETYDKAYNFLNAKSSIPNFDGEPTETFGPSPIALTYDQNQTAYVNAIGGYRTAYNSYNMDNLDDQRKFQAVAPGLQNTIDQAWNKWVREGKENVERAANAMRTSINNAISGAITQAQYAMNDQHALAAQTIDGLPKWFASYVIPTNWYDPNCKGSKLTLSSSFLATKTSDQASEYSSHHTGLFWTSSGQTRTSSKVNDTSMETNEFELSAELITVRIRRPWLNSMLFGMNSWSAKGISQNGISNGQIKGNTGILPLIPTAFVVAKDVTIKAKFTSQDTSRFTAENTSQSNWGWGWGPFSGGGTYQNGKSSGDKFQATYSDGTLKLPGLQLIAWVSAITPASPPLVAAAGR